MLFGLKKSTLGLDAFAHEMTSCSTVSWASLGSHSRHKGKELRKLASIESLPEARHCTGLSSDWALWILLPVHQVFFNTWGNWGSEKLSNLPQIPWLTWALHCLHGGLPYSAPCMLLLLLLGKLAKGLNTRAFSFACNNNELQGENSWLKLNLF